MVYSIYDAKKIILELQHALEQDTNQINSEIPTLISSLVSIFDIANEIKNKAGVLTVEEIGGIGEQAISIIDNLIYKLDTKQSEAQHQLGQISLTMADWVVSHNAVLSNIHIVVDTLALLANTLQDKTQLAELSHFMTQIAHACSNDIINDLDNANPSRPWRILNLNRGIVATRSHNLDIMNAVYPEIIKAIPMDAPGFFKEGMSEMLRLNYPDEIKELMQVFYDSVKLPAVH